MNKIVVAGGGPAGSLSASMLAADGRDVVILEEHREIGRPRHCAGIVSDDFLRRLPITPDILTVVRRAKVVFPDGRTFDLERSSPFGYVLDRCDLDQKLSDYAVGNGADLRLATSFNNVVRSDDGLTVLTNNGDVHADLLIGADGQNSMVARTIGADYSKEYLIGTQVDIHAECDDDTMVLKLGNKVAPGFFSWKVPVGDGLVRYGVCVSPGRGSAVSYLSNLVRSDGYEIPDDAERFGGRIPIGSRRTTVGYRTMLIGDAASQVKPVSAGGLKPIISAAPLLCDTVREAYDNDLFTEAVLGQYEVRWKRDLGRMIDNGMKMRRFYCKLSDDQMNKVGKVFDTPEIKEYLSDIDIDDPSLIVGPIMAQKGVKSSMAFMFLRSLL